MKVLYLTYDGITDQLGASQVLPYLLGLKAKGIEFTLVSFEKGPARSAEEVKTFIDSTGIEWIPLKYHKEPPVFSTLYDVRTLKRKLNRIVSKNKFDLVHCRSYITALAGLSLRKRKGIPFLFDMRGFWADERVDGGLWDLGNPVFRNIHAFFKKKEKAFIAEAAHVVSLTSRGAEHISQNFSPSSMSVIPCCTDHQLFDPGKYSMKGKAFTLGYLGSTGTWYMLDEMIDFFSCLKERKEDARFLMITADDPGPIRDVWLKRGLDPVDLEIRSAARSEVPAQLAEMDAMIMFILPVFSKRASSPTKFSEAMAMNVPVIANAGVGDVDQHLTRYNAGVLISSFDREAYLSGIDELEELNRGTGDSSRELSKPEYSLISGIERYREAYEKSLRD